MLLATHGETLQVYYDKDCTKPVPRHEYKEEIKDGLIQKKRVVYLDGPNVYYCMGAGTVEAKDCEIIADTTFGDIDITLRGSAKCEVKHGSAWVYAYDKSELTIREGGEVEAHDNAEVKAYGQVMVIGHDDSTLELHDGAFAILNDGCYCETGEVIEDNRQSFNAYREYATEYRS